LFTDTASVRQRRDRFEFAESFTLALAGRSQQVGELDVDDLVGAVADKPEGQRLRALRQGRIQMFADTEGADRIGRNVPVDHWLTAEVPDGCRSLLLLAGPVV
jgi:hypothetical protein